MDVLQFHFYFPQKCVMRSSSIESNNTTIYNRPILCNSQEQLGESFFFLSFLKWLCQYSEYSHWHTGNSVNRDALCPFGKKQKQKKTKMLTNKQDDMVHKFESQRATNLSGITADGNQLPNTV